MCREAERTVFREGEPNEKKDKENQRFRHDDQAGLVVDIQVCTLNLKIGLKKSKI